MADFWSSVVSGGAGLVSGLIGGLFGNKNVEDANRSNLQATRETNEMNKQLYSEEAARQNMWNERSYSEYWKQREYDSILNQRQRYEAAGINPYFALSNMQGGQAAGTTPSQSAGSPSTPQMEAAKFQAFDPTSAAVASGSAVQNAVNNYYTNRKLSADSDRQDIANYFAFRNEEADLNKKLQGLKVGSVEYKNAVEQLDYFKKAKKSLLDRIVKGNELMESQSVEARSAAARNHAERENVQLRSFSQRIYNEIFKDTKEYQKKSIIQDYKNKISQYHLNMANAGYLGSAALLAAAESNGVRIDNFQKNNINWIYRETAKANLRMMKQDLGESGPFNAGKYNIANKLLDVAAGIITGAAAGFGASAGFRFGKPGSLSKPLVAEPARKLYY